MANYSSKVGLTTQLGQGDPKYYLGYQLVMDPNGEIGADGCHPGPEAISLTDPENPRTELDGRTSRTQRNRVTRSPRRVPTQASPRQTATQRDETSHLVQGRAMSWTNEACNELMELYFHYSKRIVGKSGVEREEKGVYKKIHQEWLNRHPQSKVGRTEGGVRTQINKLKRSDKYRSLEANRNIEACDNQSIEAEEAQVALEHGNGEEHERVYTKAEVPPEIKGIFLKKLMEAEIVPRRPGKKRFWITQQQTDQLDQLFQEHWVKQQPSWEWLSQLTWACSQVFTSPVSSMAGNQESCNERAERKRKEEKRIRRLLSWIHQEVSRQKAGKKATKRQKWICWRLRKELGSDTLPNLETKYAELALRLKRIAREQCALRQELRRKELNAQWKRDPSLATLGCKGKAPATVPDREAIHSFWTEILGVEGHYEINDPAFKRWREIIDDKEIVKENGWLKVSQSVVNHVLKKAKSFTAPGIDGIRNFWLKKIPSIRVALKELIEGTINGQIPVPQSLVEGRTTLVWKGKNPESPSEYRPIACLSTLYKACTGVVAAILTDHCRKYDILPEYQRAMKQNVWGTIDCILLDEAITKDAKLRQKSLSVAWIDFQKAYDRVPHKLIIEVLRLTRCPTRLVSFLESVMPKWVTTFYIRRATGETTMTEKVSYKRGLFQGDSLSPLVFCMISTPISIALETEGKAYEPLVGSPKTHLSFMDDLKIFAASQEALVHNLRIVCRVSNAIGAKLGIEKCAQAHIDRKGRRKTMNETNGIDGTVGPGCIPELGIGETYKYLGIEQEFGKRIEEMKGKIKANFLAKTDLIWRSQLNAKNKVHAYRSLGISCLRYSWIFNVWSDQEMYNLDCAVRKILRRHENHGHNGSLVIYHRPRSMGGRGIPSLQRERLISLLSTAAYLACSKAKVAREIWELYEALEEYAQRRKGQGIQSPVKKANEILKSLQLNEVIGFVRGGMKQGDDIFTDTRMATRRLRSTVTRVLLKRDEETFQLKVRHNEYRRRMLEARQRSGVDVIEWDWIRDGRISAEAESRIMAALDQSLRTAEFQARQARFEKNRGDSSLEISPKCRLCGEGTENVSHIISKCPNHQWSGMKSRHDEIMKVLRLAILSKAGIIEKISRRHKKPLPVENENVKVLWDTAVPSDCESRKPDMLVYLKQKREIWVIEGAVCLDWLLHERLTQKTQKYQELLTQLQSDNPGWEVKLLPIVIGVFGSYEKTTVTQLESSDLVSSEHIKELMVNLSRSAVLGTNMIICRHLAAPLKGKEERSGSA